MSDDTRLLFESYEIWAVVSIKPVGPLSPREFGVAVSMFGGTICRRLETTVLAVDRVSTPNARRYCEFDAGGSLLRCVVFNGHGVTCSESFFQHATAKVLKLG
jgi:hypothetical protein